MTRERGSEQTPAYRKVNENAGHIDPFTGYFVRNVTQTFMVVCDEGWRESIVCNSMYEWAAD